MNLELPIDFYRGVILFILFAFLMAYAGIALYAIGRNKTKEKEEGAGTMGKTP